MPIPASSFLNVRRTYEYIIEYIIAVGREKGIKDNLYCRALKEAAAVINESPSALQVKGLSHKILN
jgi:hypothetical protein